MADTAAANAALTRRLPGEQGIWVFVLFDVSFFCLLFVVFLVEKSSHIEIFAAGTRSLDVSLGTINAIVLITSSWFVACAVHAAQRGRWPVASWLLCGATACGMAFGGVKAVEYAAKLRHGASPVSDGFHQFYFVSTFIHLLHVVLGVLVFAVCIRRIGARPPSSRMVRWLETAGIYWHMVDLLWIVIFTMLYLGVAA